MKATLAASVALCLSVPLLLAAQQPPVVRIYDANPQHPWNRLHAALFVRVGRDGRDYGGDRVDPLLWVGSRYLLKGPAHDHAAALLREFVDTHGDRLIDDPLKRALLQRDLWMVFDWLDGRHFSSENPRLTADDERVGQEELRRPLATVIARLALTRAQIDALPDNYASAAGTEGMPADLFTPGGPWVNLGRPEGPIARAHVADEGAGKNSVFLVMIRLPRGRDATLGYLERLRAFSAALWVSDPSISRDLSPYPNPALPQFPEGTEVVLARRALLVDADGAVVASRVTESVQHRVYRAIAPMTPQTFADAHRIDPNMFARAGQDFEEFGLNRAALLAHRRGGLMPLAESEPVFGTFSTHGSDPLESSTWFGTDAAAARRICKDCHGAPGVYSLNSYVPFRLMNGPDGAVPPQLSDISIAAAERTAVSWKQQRPEWIALKPLLTR
jgi:hypothetical protein